MSGGQTFYVNGISNQMLMNGELSDIGDRLTSKMNQVLDMIRSEESVLVALSGGVDSSLLAKLAYEAIGDGAIAVTTFSKILPPGELEGAKRTAADIGIRHITVEVNELSDLDFAANNPDRCYYCKKVLMKAMREVSKETGVNSVIEGTNAEDLSGHRPGASALCEEGAISPLAKAGFSKSEVRTLARKMGLPVADKPSMACLSSRVSYGEDITEERLEQVARAETAVRELIGVRDLRVRMHGKLARIEVGRYERDLFFDVRVMDKVSRVLKEIGFSYITLDLEGYRSGSMNEIENDAVAKEMSEKARLLPIIPG